MKPLNYLHFQVWLPTDRPYLVSSTSYRSGPAGQAAPHLPPYLLLCLAAAASSTQSAKAISQISGPHRQSRTWGLQG